MKQCYRIRFPKGTYCASVDLSVGSLRESIGKENRRVSTPNPSGATTVKLAHDRLDDLAAAMPAIAVNVGPGWEAVLANLDKTLVSGG